MFVGQSLSIQNVGQHIEVQTKDNPPKSSNKFTRSPHCQVMSGFPKLLGALAAEMAKISGPGQRDHSPW